ncbi:cupin domain-containing protein [Anaerobacillus sp. MEB173]|uniref:cupin domain-containing protein n=1 Tax=Anaerobacillus sp. MEB173 TaxID=3383345 RepID=UPI003F8E51B2
MYYGYPYPYYTHVQTPLYRSEHMTRNGDEQLVDAILSAIKGEASAINLYQRLVSVVPNQKHKYDILQALERKKANFTQFTNVYLTLTGRQPRYKIDKVPFHSYREGLQKAYEAERKGQEEYQRSCILTQHPQVRNVFLGAINTENAIRFRSMNDEVLNQLTDYGPDPFVVNIEEASKKNNTFRTALWTGDHLQVTLMSINVGEDIGLEMHPDLDQFIRIEVGQGLVRMGDSQEHLDFEEEVYDDFAFVIPAGKWHNLINTGDTPIKLYSIYAPPQHPYGTVHETKEIAMAAEEHHNH